MLSGRSRPFLFSVVSSVNVARLVHRIRSFSPPQLLLSSVSDDLLLAVVIAAAAVVVGLF